MFKIIIIKINNLKKEKKKTKKERKIVTLQRQQHVNRSSQIHRGCLSQTLQTEICNLHQFGS